MLFRKITRCMEHNVHRILVSSEWWVKCYECDIEMHVQKAQSLCFNGMKIVSSLLPTPHGHLQGVNICDDILFEILMEDKCTISVVWAAKDIYQVCSLR